MGPRVPLVACVAWALYGAPPTLAVLLRGFPGAGSSDTLPVPQDAATMELGGK